MRPEIRGIFAEESTKVCKKTGSAPPCGCHCPGRLSDLLNPAPCGAVTASCFWWIRFGLGDGSGVLSDPARCRIPRDAFYPHPFNHSQTEKNARFAFHRKPFDVVGFAQTYGNRQRFSGPATLPVSGHFRRSTVPGSGCGGPPDSGLGSHSKGPDAIRPRCLFSIRHFQWSVAVGSGRLPVCNGTTLWSSATKSNLGGALRSRSFAADNNYHAVQD